MSMEANLVARLAANAGVSAAVGRLSGIASISWGLPIQGAPLPWLVITKIDPGRDYTHSGADGLDGPRLQFDALGETQDAALALANAVMTAIETGGTQGTTKFYPGFLEAENWIDEGQLEGGRQLYRLSRDYLMHHEEV